jgi:hypothetical protein
MNQEEENAAGSLLKWQRVNALEWTLFYRRKRMGRVIAGKDCPGMWRSVLPDGGTLSDMANLRPCVFPRRLSDDASGRLSKPLLRLRD